MPSSLPFVHHHRSTTKDIREHLQQLKAVAQTLQAEQRSLVDQLQTVNERMSSNTSQICHVMDNMDNMDERVVKDHRSQSQPFFQRGIIENDFVMDGICTQMGLRPQLKNAVEAISNDQGTSADKNLLLVAVLTELTGDPYGFAHRVAHRVVQYRQRHEHIRAKPPPLPNVTSALPAPPTSSLRVLEAPGAGGSTSTPSAAEAAAVVLRDTSIPLSSPSVKSETIASPPPDYGASILPAPPLGDTPGVTSAPVETSAMRLADPGGVVALGMSTLEKNFPGLLESLTRPPTPRKNPMPTAAGAGTKRVAAPIESEPAPSPGAVKQGKKARIDKEPAIAHTFVMFMKSLEQLHQGGQEITEVIKCVRCKAIKRDARVLNCLHLYCHRCILQLRGEASKGDAIRGFQSFCVKDNCTQVVSGKTTVIDGEIIEFLQWYDKQPADVTSFPAQIQVLSSAVAKYPEDDGIQRKLDQTEKQYKAHQSSGGGGDVPCDLMQIAKLARKPY
ncbi:hypothetical protein AYL99_04943 [Fonsecaea erecta]|uniref:RING-type domain-containing protein n=1 Tax=Fonsecaea erecta TaxID=1367422 RepID=A0A178ZKD1_9EURO|nr:hypothetical protein AYL99_04943 [Fonsecaea erecta]OAP59941.1 hypothetical protein AYL99_04943 [Fonsecaea erecta]